MIFHIINLACWESKIFEKKKVNETFFCDSFSFKFLAFLFGRNLKWTTGSDFNYLIEDASACNQAVFLTSARKKEFRNDIQFTLPMFNDDVFISKDLDNFLNKNAKLKYCFIGISSPKQNELARYISKEYPDFDIYCLGATLDIYENEIKTAKFSRFGLEWLFHLFLSPKRTYTKILITLKSFLLILFSKEKRNKFYNLIQLCENEYD